MPLNFPVERDPRSDLVSTIRPYRLLDALVDELHERSLKAALFVGFLNACAMLKLLSDLSVGEKTGLSMFWLLLLLNPLYAFWLVDLVSERWSSEMRRRSKRLKGLLDDDTSHTPALDEETTLARRRALRAQLVGKLVWARIGPRCVAFTCLGVVMIATSHFATAARPELIDLIALLGWIGALTLAATGACAVTALYRARSDQNTERIDARYETLLTAQQLYDTTTRRGALSYAPEDEARRGAVTPIEDAV